MTRVVLQTSLEVLGVPQDVVVPRPITAGLSPIVLAPDWSVETTVETSWWTDLTISKSTDVVEYVSLVDRPTRRVTCQITTRSKQETHLLVGALFNYASKQSPAPLYCDQAVIEGVGEESGFLVLFGDFSYRRLFRGQRVALVYPHTIRNRESGLSQWAYVERAEMGRLVVSMPDVLPRVGDLVVPCIDADYVASASGTLLSDGILRITLTWDELPGQSALPASSLPLNGDNLDPFLAYADSGEPLLSIPTNWSEGVEVGVQRRMSTQPAGRGYASLPSGEAKYSYSIRTLSKDREDAWKVLKLFDALRGRCFGIYFISPNNPFNFKLAASDFVQAEADGDVDYFNGLKAFQMLAIYKADGSISIRKVASAQVTSGGTRHTFLLTSNISDWTSVIGFAPVHYCHLDKDALQESWLTDGICRSTFDLKEVSTWQDASIPNGLNMTFESNRDPSSVSASDPDMWLCPAYNSFYVDQSYQPVQVLQSFPWPSQYYNHIRCFDSRVSIDTSLQSFYQETQDKKRPFLERYDVFSPVLLNFAELQDNNGKTVALNAKYRISTLSGLAALPIPEMPWRVSDGAWTMMLCVTPFTEVQPQGPGDYQFGEVLRISSASQIILSLSLSGGSFGAPNGAPALSIRSRTGLFVGFPIGAFSPWPYGQLTSSLIVIVYRPSTNLLHCFINGIGASYPGDGGPINFNTFGEAVLGSCFYSGAALFPSSSLARTAWKNKGAINAFLSWQRDLSITELNEVATEISNAFGVLWQNASYT